MAELHVGLEHASLAPGSPIQEKFGLRHRMSLAQLQDNHLRNRDRSGVLQPNLMDAVRLRVDRGVEYV